MYRRDLANKKGEASYCTAHYATGEASRFSVLQLDNKGDVHVQRAVMTAPAIEKAIRETLRERGITATASCRPEVPIVVGNSFLCRLHAGTQTAVVPVKISDTTGGYVLGTTRQA